MKSLPFVIFCCLCFCTSLHAYTYSIAADGRAITPATVKDGDNIAQRRLFRTVNAADPLMDVKIMDVKTGSATRPDGAIPVVSSTSASIQNPAFSPDGSTIIYTLFHEGYNLGPAGVYHCTFSGTNSAPLIDEDGNDSVNLPGTCWNPVVNLITFASDREGPDDIWTMAADGSNLRHVSHHSAPGYYIEPSFSPDGNWIVFEADTDAPDNLQQGSIFKIRSDGTGLVKLTNGPAGGTDDRQPNWSPTGVSILFQRRLPGSDDWDIYTMDPDGKNLKQITTTDSSDTDASFSPYGNWIVYSTDYGSLDVPNIFIIPSKGGTPVRITNNSSNEDGAPSWSPDGKWIAFESHSGEDEDTPAGIWKIAVTQKTDTDNISGSITIENNAKHTIKPDVSIAVKAAGDIAITGYFLSEDSSVPTVQSFIPVDPAVNLLKTVPFVLSTGDALKTVHAWFRDAAGNISPVTSASIILDVNAPSSGKILINNESGSVSTSSISVEVSAKDTIGIVGFYLSESSTTPGSNQFNTIDETADLHKTISLKLSPAPGIKTLYAWFIDASGNISNPVSQSVNFSYGWFSVFGTEKFEEVNGIAMDADGNIYITGSTMGDLGGNNNPSIADYSAFVAKISGKGDVLWIRLVGTKHSTRGNYIAVDGSENIFIGGTYDESLNMMDAFLAKFDTSGKQQWLNVFKADTIDSQERINGIGTDDDGNVYVAGYTSENVKLNDTTTITYPNGFFLSKYDTGGTNIWGHGLFSQDVFDVNDMAVNGAGDIFITGRAVNGIDGIPGKGNGDIFIAGFNADGTKQWTHVYGTPYDDRGVKLVLDDSGNIYIAGSTKGDLDTEIDSGEKKYMEGFLGKFNSKGDKQWIRLFPSVGENVYTGGLAIDEKGSIYTAGTWDNTNNWKMFINKYSSTGSKIWIKAFATDHTEKAGGLVTGPGDLLYATGIMDKTAGTAGFAGQKFFGNGDIFVWKSTTDSSLDTKLPQGTITINNGDLTTFFRTITLDLTAKDNTGIAGYYIAENNSHPSVSSFTYIKEAALNFTKKMEYTFKNDVKGPKTVYAWYCDAFGNFSLPVSADINFSLDTIAPVPGSLTINSGAESTASTTLSLKVNATDNYGITGYYIAEDLKTPLINEFTNVISTKTFDHTFLYTLKNTKPGIVYISIWFRDGAGNINTFENRATSTIKLKDTTAPITEVTPSPGYYDGQQNITLTCKDDYYCMGTKYSINGGQTTTSYNDVTKLQITPPAILTVQSFDLDNNFERRRIITYGSVTTLSGSVPAGGSSTDSFDILPGSTLNIDFSLAQNSAASSREVSSNIYENDCSTFVTVKTPDNSIYGKYQYSGGTMNILIAFPVQGKWSMDVDRSLCSKSASYETRVKQAPDDGNLKGSASSKDIVNFLQILSGSRPDSINANNDINNDNLIGQPETIYLLQKFSNIR